MLGRVTIMLVTLFVIIRKSMELTWMTETLFTTSCKGQDKLLMWNYSLEENEKVEQLEWFYNKTTAICFKSESQGFHMSSQYTSRIEWKDTTGILLKEVSSVDTGEYTLYVNLVTEQTENTQTIFLTVYEPPTYKCKPVITVYSNDVVMCSTKTCGIPNLSHEWRIWGKRDPVGIESYLKINPSWNAELVFCCLHGPNIQCHNGDPFEFCTPTTIFSTNEDKSIIEGITDKNAPDYMDTINTGSPINVLMITVLILLTTVTFLVVFIFCLCWRKKLCMMKHQNANLEQEHTIELQRTPMLTDQQLPEENQNPKIQIVNNVNFNSDALKAMFEEAETPYFVEDRSPTASEYDDALSDIETITIHGKGSQT